MPVATSAENKEFAAAASDDRAPARTCDASKHARPRTRDLRACGVTHSRLACLRAFAKPRTLDWCACEATHSRLACLWAQLLAKRRTRDWRACGPSCLRSDAVATGPCGRRACEGRSRDWLLAGGVLAKRAVATGCLRGGVLATGCLRGGVLAKRRTRDWRACELGRLRPLCGCDRVAASTRASWSRR
jgi:hypothetical protein